MDDAFLNLCSALGVHFAVFAVADVLFVHFRQHKDRFDLDVDQRQSRTKYIGENWLTIPVFTNPQ